MSDIHFKVPQHKYFAGRIIDGPCEGEWHESDNAYFQVWRRPSIPLTLEQMDDPVHMEFYTYKWLHGYRAWAWVQPQGRTK
jgi:hypothetical protein